jgi:1,4-dihydroxy-2-naphthoyl-CoA synthase
LAHDAGRRSRCVAAAATFSASLAAGLQLEQAAGAVLYGTDDAREGIAAFAAKRKPRSGGH